MKELHLDDLKNGLPGMTSTVGAFLAEAAAFCLEMQGHKSSVILKVDGDFKEDYSLYWTDKVDEQVKRTWADENEATEYAATAIATLLVLDLTGFLISRRSKQTDKIDYYLINKNQPGLPPPRALLEISGIFHEKPGNTINSRLRIKKISIDKIPNRTLSAYIIIVAFQIPKAKITIYE